MHCEFVKWNKKCQANVYFAKYEFVQMDLVSEAVKNSSRNIDLQKSTEYVFFLSFLQCHGITHQTEEAS